MSTPSHGSEFPRELERPPVSLAPDKGFASYSPSGGNNGAAGLGSITPAFILHALLRWWKVATPIGLVLAVAAGSYVWLNHRSEYRATAWLRVESTNYIVYKDITPSRANSFAATQSQLIRSPLVLEQVLSDPAIARDELIAEKTDPVNFLANRLRVNATGGSELMTIVYSGAEAEHVARIVNATVTAYFKVQSRDDAVRMRRVVELLEDEKDRRRATVEGLRGNIRELLRRSKPKEVQEERPLSPEEIELKQDLSSLGNKIAEAEAEIQLKEAELKSHEEVLDDKIEFSPESVEGSVNNNEEVEKKREFILEQSRYLAQVATTSALGENDPSYKAVERQVAEKENELEELKESLRQKEVAKKTAVIYRNRKKAIARLEIAIEKEVLRSRVWREMYFKQMPKQQGKSNEAVDLGFRNQELRREESVLTLIEARIMKMRTEMRSPARVTLMQPAKVPRAPSNKISYFKVGVYGMVALCIPFGLAVLWEHVVRRVDGPQQLWQANLKVVGEIAKLPVASRVSNLSPFDSVGRDVSLFEESIDSLRTCLVLTEPSNQSRVIVISSAVSGEGKTSVASQLAVSIARASGEPTLLIDADMRSPDIHNVFDIPNEPGLAQVLSHECSVKDAIVTSWSNYVHLLPAGVLKASPHKLLGDGAFKALLNDVRASYRYVIIDTSPILSASESLVLAKAADATLLCAMRDTSRVDQVQKAYERLVNTGARTLGTVLNGVPTGRYAYLYGIYAYPRS